MEEREKIIRDKVEQEDFFELMQLRGVKQIVWDILTKEKGFDLKEIEVDPQFKIILSDCEAIVSIDFIINLFAESFAVIRCANSGLDFWERYISAFAKAAKDYQIPFAMVTNGYEAKIINILSGSVVGKNMKDFFNRKEAIKIMRDFRKIPCPEKKAEKEKRIIYAFEGIKCPTVEPGK